ncbi:MAG: NosD domain-containing protein [Candidatus Bathyarchaeota archaeon]
MAGKKDSVVMLILLLAGTLMVSFEFQTVEASGTIYIRADGSIDPPAAPITSSDNITYTVTGSIYDSIVVERDNIVIEGANYVIQGTGGTGVDLSERHNVTIRHVKVKAFDYGIWLELSSDVQIHSNNISTNPSNYAGIWVYNSSGSSVFNNNFTGNYDAVRLEDSSNNSVYENNLTSNFRGIMISSTFGVSQYNDIHRNYIAGNQHGIRLQYSSNNTVSRNYVAENYFGIWLYRSSNNSIYGNNVTLSTYEGLFVEYSPQNTIAGNNVENNPNGIEFKSSRASRESSNNTVYHNSFVGNTVQVKSYYSANSWDDGYPSGGNYWSDYAGIDDYNGPNQDQLGSDGIGDTQFVIDAENTDTYPLMRPKSPMPGDVNADGIVDIFDIGYISAHWHPGPPTGPLGYDVYADVNHDGAVDIFDIGITSAHWGQSW